MSNMKAIRKKAGITQADLAKALGLTQGAIAHYETGRRAPGLSVCRRIVVALNDLGAACELGDVFPEPGDEPRALAS